VLIAALEIADREGLEAATMRSIGQRLDAEAMSLYRHVRNKDDLLDGMIDLVFAETEVPMTGDWKSDMRQRSISVRAALTRHSWAVGLMESRMQPGPQNLRHHDAVLEVLLAAGFSAADATHAYNLLDSYIFGFVLQERSLPFSNAEELAEIGPQLLEQIPGDLYPNMKSVSTELLAGGFDYGAEFEFGLDLILDAVDRSIAGRAEK
jgi:AcrR family transcriptional regulator